MIIIGRHQESVDIMEKEGGLLADRPRAVAAGDILSAGLRMILAQRRAVSEASQVDATHTHLQAKAAESYAPIQMDAARDVIFDVFDNFKEHQAAANHYAASVVSRVMYGKSTSTAVDAPEIIIIHKMLKCFQNLMRPSALLVERFPIIKYLPGYTTELEEWRREESQLFHDQLNRVSKELATGEAGPSFSRYLLENQSSHKLSDEEMAYLAGSLFGAGSAVAVMVVVMAAACYPKAQEKVQEELDTVVGRDRAPTLDDYGSLPQIEAFMLECLRWRFLTTLGFAHRALADIPYGYISRDPNVDLNPDQFDPERWLDSNGKIRGDLKFPSYGFGRRICPGRHIANRSIFINLALLFWSFKITQDLVNTIDQSGFVDGVIAHPKRFAARVEPRFGDEASLRAVMAKYGEGL
ncbi:cytochrome P450 [Suillus variegatus]|nr:cytochrome P450 [Suillus variegatus]